MIMLDDNDDDYRGRGYNTFCEMFLRLFCHSCRRYLLGRLHRREYARQMTFVQRSFRFVAKI